MGRKSLALERREQILDSLYACVARYGLAGSSFDRIAKEAGMDRMLIPHYFGNRDGLITAAVERLAAEISDRIQDYGDLPPGTERLGRVLDYVCGPELNEPGAEPLLAEFFALAARDENARLRMRAVYETWTSRLALELQHAYPKATKTQCENTAFGITCMVDRAGGAIWLGMPKKHFKTVRRLAEVMANTLAG